MATTVSEALMSKDAIIVAETTHLLGHLAGIPFPDSPFLGPLVDKPEELRRRAARAVRRVVEGDAQTRPVLVLLDDMQFAEEDGWSLLAGLCQAEAHVAIVLAGDSPVAARAEALAPSGGVATGPIAPLDVQDVSAMLHVLLPTLVSVPTELAEAIAHRSEGNPGAVRNIEPFDLGLVGGFGVEFGRGLIEARYTHGLLRINTDDNEPNDRLNNRVFSVTVGLRLR
jgi:predicted ATPase